MHVVGVVVGPPVVEGVVSLFLILAFVVSLGLLWAYRATLSKLLTGLAALLDKAAVNLGFRTVHVFGPLSAALRGLDRDIEAALSAFVSATQGGVTYLWSMIAQQVTMLASWVGDFAESVEHALTRTVTVTVPKVVRITETKVLRVVEPTRVIVEKITHVGTAATRAADAALGARIKSVRELAEDALSRIKRLEKGATLALTTGLLLAAVSKAGFGWIRCRNIKRLGKRACGLDTQLLDALIADSLIFFGTISLVEFAKELQQIEAGAADAIRQFARLD